MAHALIAEHFNAVYMQLPLKQTRLSARVVSQLYPKGFQALRAGSWVVFYNLRETAVFICDATRAWRLNLELDVHEHLDGEPLELMDRGEAGEYAEAMQAFADALKSIA
jgi:hypothetical protein